MNETHRDKQMLLSLTVCGLALAAGCAPGRLDDLKDCGRISFGPGVGLDVHAKVGALTQPSVGLGAASVKYGHDSRELSGTWTEMSYASTTVLWANSGHKEGLNLSGHHGVGPRNPGPDSHPTYWLPLLSASESYDPLAFSEITDLQVGATVLVVSARVGVNPLEIVDFALGFVGLDIAGDDPKSHKTQDQSEDNSEKTPPEGQTSAPTGIND